MRYQDLGLPLLERFHVCDLPFCQESILIVLACLGYLKATSVDSSASSKKYRFPWSYLDLRYFVDRELLFFQGVDRCCWCQLTPLFRPRDEGRLWPFLRRRVQITVHAARSARSRH